MEFESTDKIEMLYETLSNIELAINRIQERTQAEPSLLCTPHPCQEQTAEVSE